MEAKELRIGNWVLIDGIPQQIENIHIDKVNLYYSCGDYEGGCGSDYYEEMKGLLPILLTEEIFSKCGLEKEGDSYIWHKCDIKYLISPRKFANDYIFSIEYTDSPFEQDHGTKYSVLFEIEFLHQLQNLYYLIQGQDLNVKL